jgi:hypothetical protein
VVDSFLLFAESADVQEQASYTAAHMVVLRAQGRSEEALEQAHRALRTEIYMGASFVPIKLALTEGFEAALELGDREQASKFAERVRTLTVGNSSPFNRAQAARFQARLGVEGGEEHTDAFFREAVGRFREIEVPFWVARTGLEYAEWLCVNGRARDAEGLIEEAVEVFTRLGATPWVERTKRLDPKLERAEQASA